MAPVDLYYMQFAGTTLATVPLRRYGSVAVSSTVNNLYIYLCLFFYDGIGGAGSAIRVCTDPGKSWKKA